jgi:hypothetical protein
VAGETGHTGRAGEIGLVERLHHDDHLPRLLDARGRIAKGVMPEHRFLRMTVGAVVAHRGREHTHGIEERVDGHSLEDLDIAEQFVRHERRRFLRPLTRLR